MNEKSSPRAVRYKGPQDHLIVAHDLPFSGAKVFHFNHLWCIMLSQIALKKLTLRIIFKATDRLLLDLTHTLTGKSETLTDLLESHLLTSDTEERLHDIPLTWCKSRKRTLDLLIERLVHKTTVSTWRVVIHEHVKKAVDAPFVEGEDNSLLDVLVNNDSPSADRGLVNESLNKEIERALSTLTPRERDIVKSFFGIGCQEMTLEEIGERFGLTRERVRQIKEKAIRRLKNNSKSKLLKSYLG